MNDARREFLERMADAEAKGDASVGMPPGAALVRKPLPYSAALTVFHCICGAPLTAATGPVVCACNRVWQQDQPAYDQALDTIGTIFTVEQWKQDVEQGLLVDYDGWGYPVKGDRVAKLKAFHPTEAAMLPADATHVLWFSR